MPLTKRQREQMQTWTIQVRLPKDVPPQRAGRYMAMVLKRLWRSFGVRCTAIKDTEP